MASLVRRIDVARPVRRVYAQWARVEDFPAFMDSVVSIRRTGEDTTAWVVKVAGERREFTARVTEQVPGQRIAWTTDGGSPTHGGVVTFHRLDDDHTRVALQLDWEPVGTFDKVADRLGLLQRRIDADLDAFRKFCESWPDAGGSAVDVSTNGHRAEAEAEESPDAPGRDAEKPSEIPAAGWLQIAKRAAKQMKADNAPIVAAGVAFFTFLAIVPALFAVVSLYGLFGNPNDLIRSMGDFLRVMPKEVRDLITTQITNVGNKDNGALGLTLAISVLAALWSSSKGMQSLITALNIAYDEDETRKFVKLRGLALILTVAMSVGVVGGAAGLVALGALASDAGSVGQLVLSVVRWPALALIIAIALAVLYRYAPDRDAPRWRWVSPGALFATVAWVIATFGFSLYAANFGKYGKTYGTLGSIVVVLTWLYLTSYIIVFGAELDAETERQTARDSTKGDPRPLGGRNAYAADTVADPAESERQPVTQ